MSETVRAQTYAEVEQALLARWPESTIDPSLERIRAICDLLGEPQRSYPVVHLTGTNGKTSTARMIDGLLRALGLRTGRFTSPHLESMTERITIDGVPLTPERFVEVYGEVAPYVDLVDASSDHPMSFFETVTAMGFAAFADAPVDAAILEVGLGGTWDATNVADAAVAVVTPVGVDHSRLLGDTPAEIAVEKAGIIKPGSFAVLALQEVEVAEVLLRRAAEVGATVAREGLEFGVSRRSPGVGGQLISISGLGATYEDVFLPLHGSHQAHNAAAAVAAVEAFAGGKGLEGGLDPQVVRAAFTEVSSPGRLEVVRRSPTVILDAAHNPHGARAAAQAIQEEFSFSPLIGVLGLMADKDVVGVLEAFEPVLSAVVCSQNSTARAMPAEALGEIARGIFGAERVDVVPRLDDALERAIALAEEGIGEGIGFGSGGVVVTGSVITAGEARTLLGGRG
ncbi:MAG: dihydrofolate synthase / folylpolyglutamate synthase [Nocardioidaceae bacterium]|jgi:dihydrofolate synthase/folylpolyglutamate synthase|nr:dihydrofolate synthase / folylpolyglutamate synthase [Nocardioidaceae bacterium]